ncbi:MAG: hypothetical protein WDN24_12720 [Sphingomonas sp.]
MIEAAEGSHSMALERVIETPGQYRLRVEWDSVDHHMVTFRESPGFKEWRALAGPFFAGTPFVEHTETVGEVLLGRFRAKHAQLPSGVSLRAMPAA